MTDWYIEISEWAPEKFRSDEYLSKVIETSSPYMNYFCQRLTELKDWKLNEANQIFSEIIEEMPIMTAKEHNGEFWISYNKWVSIKLVETPIQIYRESKIKQILA